MADDRSVGQVSREQALARSMGVSWMQRLPLVNVKRRPKGLPGEVVVYAWGSVLASGAFIVDLDNPYALTGYNLRAMALYRWVLRMWLAIQVTASSFEGADHLAHFIERGGWQTLLTGVDGGIGYLFNMGLSLIPRQLWPAKPVVAGTVAEQCWLWPSTCEGDRVLGAYIPPGFAVDFLYGFGIAGALVLAFGSGWLLGRAQILLWRGGPFGLTLISFFSYVFLFNFVRGGTAFFSHFLSFPYW